MSDQIATSTLLRYRGFLAVRADRQAGAQRARQRDTGRDEHCNPKAPHKGLIQDFLEGEYAELDGCRCPWLSRLRQAGVVTARQLLALWHLLLNNFKFSEVG